MKRNTFPKSVFACAALFAALVASAYDNPQEVRPGETVFHRVQPTVLDGSSGAIRRMLEDPGGLFRWENASALPVVAGSTA